MEKLFCENCGAEIPNESIFCNKCGSKVQSEAKEVNICTIDVDEIETTVGDAWIPPVQEKVQKTKDIATTDFRNEDFYKKNMSTKQKKSKIPYICWLVIFIYTWTVPKEGNAIGFAKFFNELIANLISSFIIYGFFYFIYYLIVFSKDGTISNTIQAQNNPSLNNSKPKSTKQQYKANKKAGIVSCPKCGSQSITTTNKKISVGKGIVGASVGAMVNPVGTVVGGAVGATHSKKIYNVCMNCGHKWKP